MEFRQVIQTCLDFSIANNGTIQSYSPPDWLNVQSRTTRTDIFIERGPGSGEWRLLQLKNAAGEKTRVSAMVTTTDGLHAQLQTLWDKEDSITRGGASIYQANPDPPAQ
jgi:hypothetical protein